MPSMDCAICMGSSVFPTQLKCGHMFCYLCVKGVSNQNNKCPLCRKKISKSFWNRPKFVKRSVNSDRPSAAFDSNQWFYEGKRATGWWAYDHHSCQALEKAFTGSLKTCELTIAGINYTVDFENSVQYRNDMPKRKRNIKRDLLANLNIAKGIAGVSKVLVKDVFGTMSSQTNHQSCGQQSSVNGIPDIVVTNNTSVEIENNNKVVVKTEIKVEKED